MISLAGPGLALDEEHRYTFGGEPVVSVTQVLREEGLVDDRYFSPEAARRGSTVHRLAELDAEGDLYEQDIPEQFRGYLNAVRAFKRETGWFTARHTDDQLLTEVRLFNESYGLAGTADEIGMSRGQTGLSLADYKTGEPAPATGLQTGAYSRMFQLATGRVIVHRLAVQLRADGTYRLHHYTNPADVTVFLGALNTHRWRLENLPEYAEARKGKAA